MTGKVQVEIPLVVVGCDFRTASARFREQLITTPEERSRLYKMIRNIHPSAGFTALETCNRVEWIVAAPEPDWIGELLSARMVDRWQNGFSSESALPKPYLFTGEAAVRHLLRVAVGLESLAMGETQITGQVQRAIQRAIKEQTSSMIINGLSSAAGRVARICRRMGLRKNLHQGIHGLTARFLENLFPETDKQPVIVVIGMGEIGRKTADTLENFTQFKVIRVNRTIRPEHQGLYHPLNALAELVSGADAVIVASGSRKPVFQCRDFLTTNRTRALVIVDIGIPRQVTPEVMSHSEIMYHSIDDLTPEQSLPAADIERMEEAVSLETARYRNFCRARDVTQLLNTIHEKRREYIQSLIPKRLAGEISDMNSTARARVEACMQQIIREFANDVFTSIHQAIDDYRQV